jgi:dolichyl-diphosphooligosaccharide--protein glycosyltransferase
MRKRAQIKSIKPVVEEPKHIVQQTKPKFERKSLFSNRKWWVAIALVSIFLLVLFFNTYYNLTSEISYNPEGDGLEKFYLSGPDPYYNMRLVEGTYETGRYPYYTETDPMLNYPFGARGGRAPLFNMMAMGFSRLLTPFMDEVDAIGYSMQFIPALFGALIIFVVYFLGKELFNYKAGLIGALFMIFIPIHLGSGHGSAYALFDHDSFNLLLFFLTFLFLVKSLKEENTSKSTLYAILAGIPLAALTMTWVEAQFLYVVISVYAIVQMFIDIFTSKIEFKIFRTASIVLWTGYLVSLPVIASQPSGFTANVPLYLCIGITAFGLLYYLFRARNIPWTISLPGTFIVGAIALTFLYFVDDLAKNFVFLAPLERLAVVIFGTGIYGNKVSMTIAEANTYTISHTVMSFGPALYWIGWAGFLLLIWHYYKFKNRRDYLFILMVFILNIWLASTAGRFLNDMVPLIAILAGWIIWMFIDWLDFRGMIRSIRSAGGGLHGIRRGIKFLHVFGIVFLAFIVIIPNAFIAFDAAVPNNIYEESPGNWTTLKIEMFGEDHRGAFGLGVGKEAYWADAFDWLDSQDTEIEDPTQRPAFISWWDYGFYEVALGGHPTVADNFQDGIPPAANFHTATSENEAVIVWIVRFLEGDALFNNGKISSEVEAILDKHLDENSSVKVIGWIENPKSAPSHGEPILSEYDPEISQEYSVGQQYIRNAVYHDVTSLLTNETEGLTDEQITWLYHDIQEATGWSIRYYGVEGYDKQIFNIFGFLSDKSLLLVGAPEDNFIKLYYDGYRVDEEGEKIEGSNTQWYAGDLKDMPDSEKRYIRVTGTSQQFKDPYFETMFYKTYIGLANENEDGSKSEYDRQIPCIGMKHFYAEYISDLFEFPYYNTGKGAVVIAKYYEGAIVNGTITFMGNPLPAKLVVQKNLTYFDEKYLEDNTFPIEHDSADTDNVGNFSVIMGADAVLQIRNLANNFVYMNITFSGDNGTEYAPITDENAMRKGNYERHLNIVIDPASIEGYVYEDENDDGVLNLSTDSLIDNVNVNIYDINTGAQAASLTTSAGYYNASEILPGLYYIRSEKDGFIINETVVELHSGHKFYNISKTKLSGLEGNVYYDDFGDEIDISNAKVDLTYVRMDLQGNPEEEIFVNSTTTDSNGNYQFSKTLNQGTYIVDVTSSEIPTPKYTSQVEVTIEEDIIKQFNISIDLTPVNVSGYTKFNNAAVDGIEIEITPDNSIGNNTAKEYESPIVSNDVGYYALDLSPGSYNVSVQQTEMDTLVYTFDGKLVLSEGQSPTVYDIALTKNSVTVSGITASEGTIVDNVSIFFGADLEVINNTAITLFTGSDENGLYTVELNPGAYNITASTQIFNISGVNYTLEWQGLLEVSSDDIETGITLDIDEMVLVPRD